MASYQDLALNAEFLGFAKRSKGRIFFSKDCRAGTMHPINRCSQFSQRIGHDLPQPPPRRSHCPSCAGGGGLCRCRVHPLTVDKSLAERLKEKARRYRTSLKFLPEFLEVTG